MSDERRQYDRFPVPARIACEGRRGDAVFHLDLKDIGMGGLLLETSVEMRIGARIDLLLQLGENSVHAQGKVVRVAERRLTETGGVRTTLGVKFKHLSYDNRRAIEEFVKKMEADATVRKSDSNYRPPEPDRGGSVPEPVS